ncbi:hypothetical protein STEG23_032618, partial [Scotinomys teguina]
MQDEEDVESSGCLRIDARLEVYSTELLCVRKEWYPVVLHVLNYGKFETTSSPICEIRDWVEISSCTILQRSISFSRRNASTKKYNYSSEQVAKITQSYWTSHIFESPDKEPTEYLPAPKTLECMDEGSNWYQMDFSVFNELCGSSGSASPVRKVEQ